MRTFGLWSGSVPPSGCKRKATGIAPAGHKQEATLGHGSDANTEAKHRRGSTSAQQSTENQASTWGISVTVFLKFFFFNFLVALGLHCYEWAFFSWDEQGLLSSYMQHTGFSLW